MTPKTTAMRTYPADHRADSFSVGSCGVRTWPMKSMVSMTTISPTVRAQAHRGTSNKETSGEYANNTEGLSHRAAAAPESKDCADENSAYGILPFACPR